MNMKHRELASVLGHDRRATSLLKRLASNSLKKTLVRGPSGSGKTELVRSVVSQVQDFMGVIWLAGSDGKGKAAYGPLISVIRQKSMGKLVKHGKNIIAAAADDFLPAGKGLAKAILNLLPDEPDGYEQKATDAVAAEFASMVSSMLRHGPLLIVLDDAQYADQKTVDFLEETATRLTERVAETHSLSLILTINTDAEAVNKYQNSLKKLVATPNIVDIGYCPRDAFHAVLTALGLERAIPARLLDLLYKCSGGHLHIARFIVDELNACDEGDSSLTDESSDLMHFIIQRRLYDIEKTNGVVAEVLCCAASVGSDLSQHELGCLFGCDQDTASALKAAEKIGLVLNQDGQFRFGHDIVRHYFVRQASERTRTYHAKYGECLRILRPGDYQARSSTLLGSGDEAGALIAFCQALIADWRSGDRTPRYRAHLAAVFPGCNAIIRDYLEEMATGYDLLFQGKNIDALTIGRAIHDGLPPILIAERDYLIAECLLKDLSQTASQEAKDLLLQWQHLKGREPELWCRMRMLLLLACVQLCQHTEALTVERGIATFLAARAHFDPNAQRQLNHLLALSDMYHAVEIASRRILQSCNFYEERLKSNGHADLYEYHICLTNAAGNLITIGDFPKAAAVAAQALKLARDNPLIRLSAPWSAANNAIIAMLLAGKISASEALPCLQALKDRFIKCDDVLLLNNNLACIRALAGDADAALKVFMANETRLSGTPDIDPLYFYIARSNLALLLQRLGRPEGGAMMQACKGLVDRLPPAVRDSLRHRHAMLEGALPTHQSIQAKTTSRFPLGFYLSDIQIWSGV